MGYFKNLTIHDLDVSFIKEYLRIDDSYKCDDELLLICLESAKSYIKSYTKQDLYDLQHETDILIACLYLTQHFYVAKITGTSIVTDNTTIKSLLSKYVLY